MRSTVASVLMVSALALTPAAAMAQSSAEETVEQSGENLTEQSMDEKAAIDTAANRGEFLNAQMADQTLSSSYIGATVLIGSGEERESVGTVSQLIFDEQDAITGAVVDVGGFLGIGAKPVGLQWDSLKRVKNEQSVAFTTSMTREELENAPAFETQAEIASEENIDMQSEGSAAEQDSGTSSSN